MLALVAVGPPAALDRLFAAALPAVNNTVCLHVPHCHTRRPGYPHRTAPGCSSSSTPPGPGQPPPTAAATTAAATTAATAATAAAAAVSRWRHLCNCAAGPCSKPRPPARAAAGPCLGTAAERWQLPWRGWCTWSCTCWALSAAAAAGRPAAPLWPEECGKTPATAGEGRPRGKWFFGLCVWFRAACVGLLVLLWPPVFLLQPCLYSAAQCVNCLGFCGRFWSHAWHRCVCFDAFHSLIFRAMHFCLTLQQSYNCSCALVMSSCTDMPHAWHGHGFAQSSKALCCWRCMCMFLGLLCTVL